MTSSSDLSVRIFASKDGANPRTLKGHTRAVTSTHVIGVGKEVLTSSKDGSIRLWHVGEGKELRKWAPEGQRAIEDMIVQEHQRILDSLQLESEERVMLAATKEGIAVTPWANPGWFVPNPDGVGHLVSFAICPELELLATGHSDGIIALRSLTALRADPPHTPLKLVRRNESPIYSLFFSGSDLYMGTAAGLPCRLGIKIADEEIVVTVKEELAGWEAVGVECWTEGHGSMWCAGGEGGIRRY